MSAAEPNAAPETSHLDAQRANGTVFAELRRADHTQLRRLCCRLQLIYRDGRRAMANSWYQFLDTIRSGIGGRKGARRLNRLVPARRR